jgi:formylglycine-generating enzyme required for sulfatase activity
MLLTRTFLFLSICLAFFSCKHDVIENTPTPRACEQAKSFTVGNPSTLSQSLISLSLSATTDIVQVDWSISQNGVKIREISSTSAPFSVSEISLNVDGKFDIKANITSSCGTYTLSGKYYYAKPVESVLVNGGTFTMGRSNGAPDERPAHLMPITSFYAGKYEVTVS